MSNWLRQTPVEMMATSKTSINVCAIFPSTHRNLTTTHLQPLHHILQRMLGAIRSYRHRRIIIGTKEVVISVRRRYVASILAEIEHYRSGEE